MNGFYSRVLSGFDQGDAMLAKARLNISFALLGAVSCTLCLIFHPYLQFNTPRHLFLIPIGMLLFSLVLIRLKLPLLFVIQYTIASFWLPFCLGIYYSGGIYSLMIPWLALLPLMAFSLINRKSAIAWFIVTAVSLLIVTIFTDQLNLKVINRGALGSLVSHVGLVLMVFLFMQLFHAKEKKLRRTIIRKNKILATSREEIAAQNEELLQQRDEIIAQRDYIEDQNKKLLKHNEEIEIVNIQLATKVSEIFERNNTLEKHWHTLLAISKSRSINFGDLEEAFKHITKTASISLHVDRVSIWHYDKVKNSIYCLLLYKQKENEYEHGGELLGKYFPHYFEALQEEDVIPADDAESDPKTLEFKDSYLKPLHILSMLDNPYFIDGKLGGVICFENTEHRHWLPEDIIFAQALSDIVTLVFKANQRRQYESKIRAHKREITRMNQSLEERIHERTLVLENQNKQLAEYAFINSHILRGPLCRILGLINLIEHTYAKTKEQELIDHLKLSGEELDNVVKQINKAIDSGSHFNRNELTTKRPE
jgi:GAF domain-containing protein